MCTKVSYRLSVCGRTYLHSNYFYGRAFFSLSYLSGEMVRKNSARGRDGTGELRKVVTVTIYIIKKNRENITEICTLKSVIKFRWCFYCFDVNDNRGETKEKFHELSRKPWKLLKTQFFYMNNRRNLEAFLFLRVQTIGKAIFRPTRTHGITFRGDPLSGTGLGRYSKREPRGVAFKSVENTPASVRTHSVQLFSPSVLFAALKFINCIFIRVDQRRPFNWIFLRAPKGGGKRWTGEAFA